MTNTHAPVIGIDFDGTIMANGDACFPEATNEPIPGAIRIINGWYDDGFYIVIHSCRYGVSEQHMIDWLDANGVRRHAVNENLPHRIEAFGGDTRKISCDVNLDDKNIDLGGRPVTRYTWAAWDSMIRTRFQKR
ncbi:MAG: hypothetical protein PHI87_00100 [Candidatus Methanomethylophilus sp.]|nr:hypothetical protein [Methanomethylophilus sp.]